MLNMVSSCRAWYSPLLSKHSLQHRHSTLILIIFRNYNVKIKPFFVFCLPVHASHSQVNVWILKQHPREEVLLGRVHHVRCIYNLDTNTVPSVTLSKFRKKDLKIRHLKMERQFLPSTWKSCLLDSGSHSSFSMLPLATNKVVTALIRIQQNMKEKPTPLWVWEREGS